MLRPDGRQAADSHEVRVHAPIPGGYPDRGTSVVATDTQAARASVARIASWSSKVSGSRRPSTIRATGFAAKGQGSTATLVGSPTMGERVIVSSPLAAGIP